MTDILRRAPADPNTPLGQPSGPGMTVDAHPRGVLVVDGVALTGEQKAAPEGRVTWDEFLAWLDDKTRAEWVDGEVVPLSPSNLEHQDVIGFLYELVLSFVRVKRLGRVYFGILMRLAARRSGREPDLLFVANEHVDRFKGTLLDGPADLVVEVVSPDSDARDRGDKFIDYEAAGIPEYWLLDPIRGAALFYQLGADGRYRLVPIGEDGIYRSAVLAGFSLHVEWLWQRPLPVAGDLLHEIGL